MKVYVESKNDIKECKADARGSVTLGSDYADAEVQLTREQKITPHETHPTSDSHPHRLQNRFYPNP